jgi:HEAT repeat protein
MKNALRLLLIPVMAAATAAGAADLSALADRAARYQSGGDVIPIRELERALVATIDAPADRAQAEAALIRMLAADAAFEARRFACERLSEYGTDAAVPALAGLLGAEETAGIACTALGGIRTEKAAEALRAALTVSKGPTRVQVISALGLRRDEPSSAALAGLARDTDAAVARAAIAALGRIASPGAVAALAALRKDAPAALADDVAAASLDAAERMADRAGAVAICAEVLKTARAEHLLRGAYAALLRADPDGGLARIRAALRAMPREAILVPVAIARVAELKDAGTSKTLGAMLPGLLSDEQVWMIEALAVRGDADARAAIRGQVSSTNAAARRAALAAVGRLEDAAAVPLLVSALAGAAMAEDKAAAEQALACLRGGSVTDSAIAAAMRKAQGGERAAMIGLLARRGASAAVPALLIESDSADPAIARAAYQALSKLAGAAEVPALLQRLAKAGDGALRGEAEAATARAISRMPDAAAKSKAVRGALAANPGIEARGALLRLLAVAGDATALEAIRKALADGDARVRDAAVRALATWPDAAGWDALAVVFQKPENDAQRALAFGGLVRMTRTLNAKPDDALIARYQLLVDGLRTDEDRKQILGALAGVAHPAALDIAVPMLDVPAVRAEAILALKGIIPAVKPSHPKEAVEAWKKMKAAEGQP